MHTQETSRPFVTIREAAEATGLSVFFVRQMAKEGRLVTLKSGRKTYVNLPESMAALTGTNGGDRD